MIQTLNFVNPITEQDDTYNFELPEYSLNDWGKIEYELKHCGSLDAFINKVIDDMTPVLYKNAIYFGLSSFNYRDTLGKLFRVLDHYDAELDRNGIIDRIIDKHIANILLEEDFKNQITITKQASVKHRAKSKSESKPNKWFMNPIDDMFSGKTRYMYQNLKTGECFESDNPNLLEELNVKKKKKEKIKPVIEFTFRFNAK